MQAQLSRIELHVASEKRPEHSTGDDEAATIGGEMKTPGSLSLVVIEALKQLTDASLRLIERGAPYVYIIFGKWV